MKMPLSNHDTSTRYFQGVVRDAMFCLAHFPIEYLETLIFIIFRVTKLLCFIFVQTIVTTITVKKYIMYSCIDNLIH